MVEALVERGADVTILNEEGKSALDLSSNHLKLAVLGKYSKNGDAKHGKLRRHQVQYELKDICDCFLKFGYF